MHYVNNNNTTKLKSQENLNSFDASIKEKNVSRPNRSCEEIDKSNPSYSFLTVKNHLYEDVFLNKNDRVVYFYLLSLYEKQYLKGKLFVRVKQSTIANRKRLSIDQVKRAIKKLTKYNYVSIEKQCKFNFYYINFEKFSLETHSKRTQDAPIPHLTETAKPVQQIDPRPPVHNYYNHKIQIHNKQQQTSTRSSENVVVINENLKEKAEKASLNIQQVNHFVREGYEIKIIEKCLDYFIWLLKQRGKPIENKEGYFANLIVAAHKGIWDFSRYESYCEKQVKIKEKVEKLNIEEQIREQEKSKALLDAEKKYNLLDESERQRLLKKAKFELPNCSDFVSETLVKAWLKEGLV